MKPVYSFVNELRLVGHDAPSMEVVIRTDRQLVPNASYDFEVRVEGGQVWLTPTERKTS